MHTILQIIKFLRPLHFLYLLILGLFIWSLFALADGIVDNSRFIDDLLRAASDVRLELGLTGLLTVGLFTAGEVMRHRSKHHKSPAIAPPGSGLLISKQAPHANYQEGISTELMGAVITTVFLGMLVLIFQQYQSIQNRKAELILQLGSPSNAFALEAARQLAYEGLLYDGSLQGVDLRGANLAGANLQNANLQEVNLRYANLTGANLELVNLQEADLWDANLQGANLQLANLQEADLRLTNLQHTTLHDAYLINTNLIAADFRSADLGGANLQSAILEGTHFGCTNLQGANLRDAWLSLSSEFPTIFNRQTVLPDSSSVLSLEGNEVFTIYWAPDTDMQKYTNSDHPEFWQAPIKRLLANSARIHRTVEDADRIIVATSIQENTNELDQSEGVIQGAEDFEGFRIGPIILQNFDEVEQIFEAYHRLSNSDCN